VGSAGALIRDGGPGVDLAPDDRSPVIHDDVPSVDGDAAPGAGRALTIALTFVGAIRLTRVGAIPILVGAISPSFVSAIDTSCRCDRDTVGAPMYVESPSLISG
jgi:hypothetical protein